MAGPSIKNLAAGDLSAVARVHCAAFPKSAITAFGHEAVCRYYSWQLLGPHDAVAVGAVNEQELLGFCFAGLFNGATSGFLRKHRAFLLGRLLFRPWLAGNELIRTRMQTGLKLLWRLGRRPLPPPPRSTAKSFGILSIAVSPKHQGSGIGKMLMLHCEAAAREMGLTQMHLTVDPANTQAVTVYERWGWTRAEEGGRWKGRMTKQLCP